MLDPREVRIGNWVIKVTGKDSLDHSYLEYKPVAIDEHYYSWAKYCFPIKLTTEILSISNFSFKADNWIYTLFRDNIQDERLYLKWNLSMGWYLNFFKIPYKILYLHQLQNLIYAITGKELNVVMCNYINTDLIQPIKFHKGLIKESRKSELL
jgi:hypothetical protein